MASLEGRTIGSVVDEALRLWFSTRLDKKLEMWLKLKEACDRNFNALKKELRNMGYLSGSMRESMLQSITAGYWVFSEGLRRRRRKWGKV